MSKVDGRVSDQEGYKGLKKNATEMKEQELDGLLIEH